MALRRVEGEELGRDGGYGTREEKLKKSSSKPRASLVLLSRTGSSRRRLDGQGPLARFEAGAELVRLRLGRDFDSEGMGSGCMGATQRAADIEEQYFKKLRGIRAQGVWGPHTHLVRPPALSAAGYRPPAIGSLAEPRYLPVPPGRRPPPPAADDDAGAEVDERLTRTETRMTARLQPRAATWLRGQSPAAARTAPRRGNAPRR